MTNVLQNKFWELEVGEEGFSVGLSFNQIPTKLSIPFAAITAFVDPAVDFGLQFQAAVTDIAHEEHENAQNDSAGSEGDDPDRPDDDGSNVVRSEEHTSELQSLMRNSYAVFFLKKKIHTPTTNRTVNYRTTVT